MRKLIYALTLILVIGVSIPGASASEKKEPGKELTAAEKVKLERLSNRVEEIRLMDKSQLSREEKKALRKELKEIKREVAFLERGVYLSVGAIIIILLVILIIF